MSELYLQQHLACHLPLDQPHSHLHPEIQWHLPKYYGGLNNVQPHERPFFPGQKYSIVRLQGDFHLQIFHSE